MNFKKIVNILCAPIKNNFTFYLALIALFSISIISIEYGRCSRMRAGFEMFFDVYALCLFVSLIPSKIRTGAKTVIFFLLYVIGLADMACYVTMGIAFVPSILQTWIQTDLREASEMLSMHTGLLLRPPFLLLFILPAIIWLVHRRKLTFPYSLTIPLLLLTLASAVYGINNKRYLYLTYMRTSDDDMEEATNIETMTREFLPVYRLAMSIKEISRFKNMRERLLLNMSTTHIDSCTFCSPQIVLIIGESYNRHHSSLYGYDKPTTPLQEELAANGNMYVFDNVISSYNLTYKSFQNMLTFYNYESTDKWYNYPIVPAIFKKAGYEVAFFSNQLSIKKSSAFSDYSEEVFMANQELSQYMFNYRNMECHTYDMQLLNDYDYYCNVSDSVPHLTIFHFIGIHADFAQRYPYNYKTFSTDDYNRQDLNEAQKQTLADYDNAIVYNDHVVASIVEKFSSGNTIIIYVPDHGELVYDGCNEIGRNFKNTEKYIRSQFDIPFWIYCTDKYKETHKEICRQIELSVQRPFMTDDLPHLLVYLAGIGCKEYQPERNLIEDVFNSARKRMIRGETDYDSVISKRG